MTPAENKRLKELEKEGKLRLMELLIWTEGELDACRSGRAKVEAENFRLQSDLSVAKTDLRRERDIVNALTRMANR
jgi:hypothetical protein